MGIKKVLGILIKVFDAKFRETKIEYRIHGSPLEEFVGAKHPIIVRKLNYGSRAPKSEDVEDEYKIGRLWYWGFIIGDTHAKEGRIIYMERSDAKALMAKFPDFFKLARHSVYLGSALLAQGNTYGSTRKKNMRILVVKRGTRFNGMVFGDGSIAFNKRTMIPKRGSPIKLGPTSNNFSILQHLDWQSIKADVKMLAGELATLYKNVKHDWLVHGKTVEYTDRWGKVHKVPGLGLDDEYKKMFLEINPQLAKHPWFVRGASSGSARWILSHAWAPYMEMRCYLAVCFDKWTLPSGKYIAYRHPVLAGGSLKAFYQRAKNVTLPDTVLGGAVARITGFWNNGAQFTIKGAGVIMNLPDGIDIVTTEDNIKIGKRVGDVTLTADAVCVIIQRFQRKALLGVPYAAFQKMNGDYDGDLINIVKADNIPLIYENVKLHEKDGTNFKLPRKNNDPWSVKNVKKLLLNAMSSNMGWATVLHSEYLARPQKDREALVERLYPLCERLAVQMELDRYPKKPSVMACLAIMQAYVQFNVEAIKNVDCDIAETIKTAAQIQSLLQAWINEFSKTPNWLVARRALEAGVLFQTSFPLYLDELDPELRSHMQGSKKIKRQWEWKIHGVEIKDSVPDECFRLHRKILASLWDEVVDDADPYAPYTFAPWVEPISQREKRLGEELCDLFRQHILSFDVARTRGIVNLFDPEDVAIFRDQWRDICIDFAEEHFGGDEWKCSRVLWRVSHEIGERRLTGATFLGFPEEAKKIVTKWSGTIRSHNCIVVGLKGFKLYKEGLPSELQGMCELLVIGGKTCVRPIEAIKGHGERLFGNIADIEKGESQQGLSIPPEGTYSYKFKLRESGSAYYATFEPIVASVEEQE